VTHRFVDTHCHFDFPPFTGMKSKALRKRRGRRSGDHCAGSGSGFFPVCWISPAAPALYAALGLHPIVIERHLDEHIERLDEIVQTAGDKLVAIGEIGLDLYREDPQFERQQTILDAQLRLAKRTICR
jgi:TatD DNase family protein